MMDRRGRLIARARQGYRLAYGVEPTHFYAAPGRVNLIGEHVDYNGGYVLPCAIDRETIVALGVGESSGHNSFIEAVAIDMGSARDRFSALEPIEKVENNWQNHVRGVAKYLLERGKPLKPVRMAIAGDVPIGSGLSSSASLGVAVSLALSSHSGIVVGAANLAEIAQRAENEFAGCACGIMDQMASACSIAGHALLLDCGTLENMPIPISEDLAIVVIDSGVRRELTQTGYNDRRGECEEAARILGIPTLRKASLDTLEAKRDTLGDVLYRRARHVVSEIARVEPAAVALAHGDHAALSQILRASHVSLRDDFEVSVPPVDRLVDCVSGALGDAGGVRLTGAGFGGSIVAVVQRDAAGKAAEAVDTLYNPNADIPARTDIYQPSEGASVVG